MKYGLRQNRWFLLLIYSSTTAMKLKPAGGSRDSQPAQASTLPLLPPPTLLPDLEWASLLGCDDLCAGDSQPGPGH